MKRTLLIRMGAISFVTTCLSLWVMTLAHYYLMKKAERDEGVRIGAYISRVLHTEFDKLHSLMLRAVEQENEALQGVVRGQGHFRIEGENGVVFQSISKVVEILGQELNHGFNLTILSHKQGVFSSHVHAWMIYPLEGKKVLAEKKVFWPKLISFIAQLSPDYHVRFRDTNTSNIYAVHPSSEEGTVGSEWSRFPVINLEVSVAKAHPITYGRYVSIFTPLILVLAFVGMFLMNIALFFYYRHRQAEEKKWQLILHELDQSRENEAQAKRESLTYRADWMREKESYVLGRSFVKRYLAANMQTIREAHILFKLYSQLPFEESQERSVIATMIEKNLQFGELNTTATKPERLELREIILHAAQYFSVSLKEKQIEVCSDLPQMVVVSEALNTEHILLSLLWVIVENIRTGTRLEVSAVDAGQCPELRFQFEAYTPHLIEDERDRHPLFLPIEAIETICDLKGYVFRIEQDEAKFSIHLKLEKTQATSIKESYDNVVYLNAHS